MNALTRFNRPTLFGPSPFGRSFERFFEDFFGAPRSTAGGDEDIAVATWAPAADVRETDAAVFVDLELPGLKKEDIDVSVEDNTLKISGERRYDQDESKGAFQRVERFYGKFSRSFRLSRHVDTSKVKASFEDGVLHLELPKTEEARPRQIEIN